MSKSFAFVFVLHLDRSDGSKISEISFLQRHKTFRFFVFLDDSLGMSFSLSRGTTNGNYISLSAVILKKGEGQTKKNKLTMSLRKTLQKIMPNMPLVSKLETHKGIVGGCAGVYVMVNPGFERKTMEI